MNKILKYFFILYLVNFIGCSNLNCGFNESNEILFRGKKLEIGDILIKEKNKKWLMYWGHSSIVVSENMVGDFPKIGKNIMK